MISCVIPARMGSTRFPGKPLVKIHNKEMILWVIERAHKADCFKKVICATDSLEIFDCVKSAGFDAYLTEGYFATGSDRVCDVANKLNLDLVINLQGDEPLVNPILLQNMADKLKSNPNCWITAASNLKKDQYGEKSEVKIKVEKDEAIEFQRVIEENNGNWYAHRGIYGYSSKNLNFFCNSKQTNAEKSLSLEQLRIFDITTFKVVFDDSFSVSVDIPNDLIRVEEFLQKNVNI